MSHSGVSPLERVASSLVLLLALLSLFAIGLGGLGKFSPLGDDFHVFYRAGDLLLQGRDPWLELMGSAQPFSYPPHALALFAVLACLPAALALGLHLLLSLLAIAAICHCANRWFLKIESFGTMRFSQAAPLALIIGNPYTATSLYQGQMTLIVTAAIMLSWLSLTQGRRVQAGLFLMIATLKPQLCILYLIWLVLAAELGVLLVGGLAAVVLLLPVLAVFGVVTPFASWLTSFNGYASIAINMPGSPYVTGLQSFLAAHGIMVGSVIFVVIGSALAAVTYIFRNWLDDFLVLQLLLVLACTFLFMHDYDYVAILLVWSCALHVALTRGRPDRLVVFIVLSVPFFMPQRLIRDLDIPTVVHARTFILLAMCLVLVQWRLAGARVASVLPLPLPARRRA
jgi:hypothetical protein